MCIPYITEKTRKAAIRLFCNQFTPLEKVLDKILELSSNGSRHYSYMKRFIEAWLQKSGLFFLKKKVRANADSTKIRPYNEKYFYTIWLSDLLHKVK